MRNCIVFCVRYVGFAYNGVINFVRYLGDGINEMVCVLVLAQC